MNTLPPSAVKKRSLPGHGVQLQMSCHRAFQGVNYIASLCLNTEKEEGARLFLPATGQGAMGTYQNMRNCTQTCVCEGGQARSRLCWAAEPPS